VIIIAGKVRHFNDGVGQGLFNHADDFVFAHAHD